MEDARCVDFYGYFPAHGWPPSCLQQPGWKLTPTEPSRSSSASRPSKSRQRSTRCGNPSCAISSARWATRSPSKRRSEEHTSELQSRQYLVCRLLLEKKKSRKQTRTRIPL